jgi:hypothetical protein
MPKRRGFSRAGLIALLAANGACGSRTGIWIDGELSGIPNGAGAFAAAGGGPSSSGASGSAAGSRGGTTAMGSGGTLASATSGVTDCVNLSYQVELEKTQLVLIVDASSSMGTTPAGSTRSSWEVLRDALLDAVATGFHPNTALGLVAYPNMAIDTGMTLDPRPSDACVNVSQSVRLGELGEAGSEQRRRLADALNSTTLARGTPTHDAYRYGLEGMLLVGLPLSNSRSNLLLITDGSPTLLGGCVNPNSTLRNVDAQPIVAEIAEAYAAGLHSYLIGLPGSETSRAWLSEAAFAGGTPNANCQPYDADRNYCHLDITTAPDYDAALRNALSKVAAAVSPCQLDVSVPFATDGSDWTRAADPRQYAPLVSFGDGRQVWLLDKGESDVGCAEGYRFISANRIELCRSTCAAVYADPSAKLRMASACMGPPPAGDD